MSDVKRLSLGEIKTEADVLVKAIYADRWRNDDFYGKKGIRRSFDFKGRGSYIQNLQKAGDGYKKLRDSLPSERDVLEQEKKMYEEAKKAVETAGNSLRAGIVDVDNSHTEESERASTDVLSLARITAGTPSAGVLKEIDRKRSYVRDSQRAQQMLRETMEDAGILDDYSKRMFDLRYATMQKAEKTIDKVKAEYESGKPQAPQPKVRSEQPAKKGDDVDELPSFLRRPSLRKKPEVIATEKPDGGKGKKKQGGEGETYKSPDVASEEPLSQVEQDIQKMLRRIEKKKK